MLGHDHALTGAIAFTAAAPLLHVGAAGLAAGAVFTAGAALLPDIDEPGSTIAREGGFATRTLAWIARRAAGGHRKGTHSAIGVAVFAAASWGTVAAAGHLHGRWHVAALVVLGVFAQWLLAAALHALRLGGHHGDALAAAGAAAAVYWHWGLTLIPLCIAIGAVAHIAGDSATEHGCPLLYPVSGHDFHVLPLPMCFKTGKWVEHWVVSPLLLAALGFLLWHDTGAVYLAGHAHTAMGAR